MITSDQNTKIKFVRSLSKRKFREKHNCFYIEGHRAVTEGILLGKRPQMLLVSESYTKQDSYVELLDICFAQGIDAKQVLLIANDKVFSQLSDTKTPQGIGGVFQIPVINKSALSNMRNIVLLEHLQDPGNMGTIIRTADAAGFDAVVCSKGTVDVYNSKVLRSTVGSIFRIDIVMLDEDTKDFAVKLKERGFKLYCAHPRGDLSSFETEFGNHNCIVIGNEANGVSDKMLSVCDYKIYIPMPGRAESLNASVAAALMIYEVVRKSD